MAKKVAKKARIVYKDDPVAKAAELEAFLFGNGADAAEALQSHGAGAEDDDDMMEGRQQDGPAGPSLFFEDKAGRSGAAPADSDDEQSSSSDSEAAEEPAAAGAAGTQSSESGNDDDAAGSDDGDEDDGGLAGRRKAAGAAAAAAIAAADAAGSDEEPAARAKAPKKERAAKEAPPPSTGRGGSASTSSLTPAWTDPDEEGLRVNVARASRLRKLRTTEEDTVFTGEEYVASLRKQHVVMNPRTSWAQMDDGKAAAASARRRAAGYGGDSDAEDVEPTVLRRAGEGDADAEALLQKAGGLLVSSAGGVSLPQGTLEVSRLRNANQHEVGDAVLRSVDWHPNGQLLLTAGMDKKLRVFQVDGVRNPKVQSVYLEDCPITRAAFAAGGMQVVASGARPFFYVMDLTTGRAERVKQPAGSPKQTTHEVFAVSPSVDAPMVAFVGEEGYVSLVSLKSRQWAGHVKMNGTAKTAAFLPDTNMLLTSGGDGLVYTWDLRTRRCLHTLVDEGNIGSSSSLSMSSASRFMASGADSGVVNVYRGASALPAAPASVSPLKALMNLTTTIDTLVFNHDAQILAMASSLKKNALRLVHLPSLTVFSNWPTGATPLGRVHCAAFSPSGGLLAIGNAKGQALLYRLNHYPVV